MKTLQAANRWVMGQDTGVSSKAIWSVMMGVPVYRDGWGNHPHDPDDFGRCYRLLKAIPAWRARLSEMSAVSKTWARLVARWHEIEALYEEEVGAEWTPNSGTTWTAPRTYALMQELGA